MFKRILTTIKQSIKNLFAEIEGPDLKKQVQRNQLQKEYDNVVHKLQQMQTIYENADKRLKATRNLKVNIDETIKRLEALQDRMRELE